MSVWPERLPADVRLSGTEGQLVAVSISVDPRRLETLLDVLARVGFPVNPEILHDAAMVYRYPDGTERTERATLVEFPAYERHLEEVRSALESNGFRAGDLFVTSMLDDIHSARHVEPAPAGAPYVARYRMKHKVSAA